MARRKRTSPAEDLMDLVALLPWWAGVAIAIVTYLVLHSFATQPPPAFGKPGELGLPLAQVMVRAMATVGQYLIPLLCLAGAGASAWRRRQRTQLPPT
jgi:restriction system protein